LEYSYLYNRFDNAVLREGSDMSFLTDKEHADELRSVLSGASGKDLFELVYEICANGNPDPGKLLDAFGEWEVVSRTEIVCNKCVNERIDSAQIETNGGNNTIRLSLQCYQLNIPVRYLISYISSDHSIIGDEQENVICFPNAGTTELLEVRASFNKNESIETAVCTNIGIAYKVK
jgi:hypothetical protein